MAEPLDDIGEPLALLRCNKATDLLRRRDKRHVLPEGHELPFWARPFPGEIATRGRDPAGLQTLFER